MELGEHNAWVGSGSSQESSREVEKGHKRPGTYSAEAKGFKRTLFALPKNPWEVAILTPILQMERLRPITVRYFPQSYTTGQGWS